MGGAVGWKQIQEGHPRHVVPKMKEQRQARCSVSDPKLAVKHYVCIHRASHDMSESLQSFLRVKIRYRNDSSQLFD